MAEQQRELKRKRRLRRRQIRNPKFNAGGESPRNTLKVDVQDVVARVKAAGVRAVHAAVKSAEDGKFVVGESARILLNGAKVASFILV